MKQRDGPKQLLIDKFEFEYERQKYLKKVQEKLNEPEMISKPIDNKTMRRPSRILNFSVDLNS